MLLQGRDGILYLVDDIEGVLVAGVRENDVDQRVGQVAPVVGRALEGIAIVNSRVRDTRDATAQHDEASDGDAALAVSATVM